MGAADTFVVIPIFAAICFLEQNSGFGGRIIINLLSLLFSRLVVRLVFGFVLSDFSGLKIARNSGLGWNGVRASFSQFCLRYPERAGCNRRLSGAAGEQQNRCQ